MKKTVLLAVWAGAMAAGPVQAQQAAPTPEGAARFIDSILGNGVTRIGRLTDSNNADNIMSPMSSRTSGCRTRVVMQPLPGRQDTIELDWTKFVAANSFFPESVKDRWGARVLTRATTTSVNLVTHHEDALAKVGVLVEPGTPELRDRLIRAADFYGKHCAPDLDTGF